MAIDKTLLAGSTSLLIMKLLEERDMYGYQMIEELRRQSNNTFDMKAGTLYPLLHTLEQKGYVEAWEEETDSQRPRRYYRLTDSGKAQLTAKISEWNEYSTAVNMVLKGGVSLA